MRKMNAQCKIQLFISCIFIVLSLHAQEPTLLFENISVEQGLSQNSVTSVAKDKYGFIWIATLNGLNRYDGYTITTYKTVLRDINSLSNNRIVMLVVDDNGTLWAETFDGIYNRYNYDYDNFTRIPPNVLKKSTLESLEEKQHNLGSSYNNLRFLVNGEKFRCINQITNDTIIFENDPVNPYSIADNYVNFAYLDNHNILWLGTNNRGAEKIDLERPPFFHYQRKLNNPNSLASNNVRAILEDRQGRLWIGTRNDGITLLNRQDNTYKHIRNETGKPKMLPSNEIRTIFEDRNGNIWVGTVEGIGKFDISSGKWVLYNTSTFGSDNPERVNYIMEDHQGTIWAGTSTGICRFDQEKDIFITYPIQTKTDLKGRVRVILEDSQHNFWLGCDGGGLIKLERNPYGLNRSDQFVYTHYILDESKNSISNNRVYTLCEDEENNIWAGTAGGLNKLDRDSNIFTLFTEENGLPDNMILGILKDKNGYLWLSHKRGISCFNPKNNTFRNYTPNDGLQGLEFNEDAYFMSKDGEMFFGGINGFNSFFPDSIKNNMHLPQMVILDLKIQNKDVPVGKEFNGRIILQKSIVVTNEIKLRHIDRSIQIEFAALHYSNPNANKYEYKLEGFDEDWIETDARHRIAAYANLKPKTYYFKVIGSNKDNEWQLEPATLKIIVLPPWWETLWFRISIGLLILILIISVYIVRVSTLKRQTVLLEKKVEQRTVELRIANTSLENQKNEIDNQKQQIERSYNNIKVIADFGQKLTSTLHLEDINNLIFDYVKSLMEVTSLGIGIFNPENDCIEFPALLENGSPIDGFSSPLSDDTSCAAWCYKNKQVIFLGNFTQEYPKYISQINIRTSQSPESLIYLPLFVENRIIGVLTVQSIKKNAYSEQDLSMLQTLASYIAIALDNANIYKQLEESNQELKTQTEIAKEANELLLGRQQKIEEQTHELKTQADELYKKNLTLNTLNTTKDKFFSIIAHDLKNPFGTILGFSELLLKKYNILTEEKKRQFILLIFKSSQNIYNLLQNLLQWARSQTGNIPFNPEHFNLKEIIDNTVSLLEDMLKEKGNILNINMPDECMVFADKNMIQTVLRNLVTNAIKFTDQGVIDVQVSYDKNNVKIAVADTGIGIRKEKLLNLFELGSTTSNEGTRGEAGTGLGLIICKEFVEKNGGVITVQSEVGEGSTFCFTVPKDKR